MLKLKYAATLVGARAESRPEGSPYVGLENIQSRTGKLLSVQGLEGDELADGTSTVNLFEPGDVLFGKLRPYLAKAWVATFAGACTTEALVLRPKDCIRSDYLCRALLAPDFIREVDTTTFGSKMPRADWADIGNIEIYVPPLAEQCEIERALSTQADHISALIEAKQSMLDLLTEKRRALVANAVTRGLNPEVRMRESNIDWLGYMPTHWRTERTRWLFTEIDERSEDGSEELLTVSHLTGVTTRAEKEVNMFLAESNEGYKRCRAGDLVINTLWAWMGAMGVARQEGIVSPAYNVYRPVQAFDPDYLDYLVRTPMFVAEITRYSKGVWSSRMRLYPEGLFEAWMPVPPLSEQTQIARTIADQVQHMDGLSNATKDTVALLEERRTALIARAVSGHA
ncbi:restriction endonuclease subunit S [Paucibacter sp. XJ19-41]|nr:restriction endonuclease subunit S [Paucibacter sp. XJ19-41]